MLMALRMMLDFNDLNLMLDVDDFDLKLMLHVDDFADDVRC